MTSPAKTTLSLSLGLLLASTVAVRAEVVTTTFVIVRHTEKAEEPKGDPVLSDDGAQRARKLARMLSSAEVSALYACADHQRTALTLGPLSESGLAINKPSDADLVASIDDLVERHRGGLVVIASHSNVVPALVRQLSGIDVGEIDESEYDDLFVLSKSGNRPASLLRLKYGRTTD